MGIYCSLFIAVRIGRMHPDPIVESRYVPHCPINMLVKVTSISVPSMPPFPLPSLLPSYPPCLHYLPPSLSPLLPHLSLTSSLSSVEPPQVWFDVKLPQHVIDEGRLSSLQLEAVVYSSQQHMNILADGSRAGFLVGSLF